MVCTGNVCRSAFAERLARAYLHTELGDDAPAIRIVSAGTRAVVDSAMHPDTALVLRGFGAEAGDFRARQLQDAMAAEAGLILTMTRGHRHQVLERTPRALQRTFTLREAADLVQFLDEEGAAAGGPDDPAGLVSRMAAARSRRHSSRDDDIRDPIGQPIAVHEEVGEAIAAALLPVLRRLADLRPGRPD
jgi:protein-tyrosine-phosphatase